MDPGGLVTLRAPNPGPFTLDGTRTYVILSGPRRGAFVIDPGPGEAGHIERAARIASGEETATILLTHGHGDHAEGAPALARRLGARVRGPGYESMEDGEVLNTSLGGLEAIHTPGHAREHYCFGLLESRAVFTGDLILGEGDTTWVGEYSGGVADYLTSLDKLEEWGAQRLLPGHGEPILDPVGAIRRYRRHRLERVRQVRDALSRGVPCDPDRLAAEIYGELEPRVFSMAARGVRGILDFLERK